MQKRGLPLRTFRPWNLLRTGGVPFLLALVVAFVQYWNVLGAGFYQDDYLWLAVARDTSLDVSMLLQSEPLNSEFAYRIPQRVASAAVYSQFGFSATAFHSLSIVLHAAVSAVLYGVLIVMLTRGRVARGWIALVSSAVGAIAFLTTSNHSMAVTWIAAQSDLWAALGVLVLLNIAATSCKKGHQSNLVPIAAVMAAVCFWSKSTSIGVAAPVLALGYLWPNARWGQSPVVRAGAVAGLVGIAHVALVRFVGAASEVSQPDRFGIGVNTLRNLSGAAIGPLLSAADYEWLIPRSVDYIGAAMLTIVSSVWLANRWGMSKQVLWCWVWTLALAVPVSLMTYEQYSGSQFTVNRYYYAPAIGSAALLAVGVGALLRSSRFRTVKIFVLVVAIAGHVAYHTERIRFRAEQMESVWRADQGLVEATLRAVQEQPNVGTTIAAMNWPHATGTIAGLSRVYFEPRGLRLYPEDDLTLPVDSGSMFSEKPSWVAYFEAEAQRFVIVPLNAMREAD